MESIISLYVDYFIWLSLAWQCFKVAIDIIHCDAIPFLNHWFVSTSCWSWFQCWGSFLCFGAASCWSNEAMMFLLYFLAKTKRSCSVFPWVDPIDVPLLLDEIIASSCLESRNFRLLKIQRNKIRVRYCARKSRSFMKFFHSLIVIIISYSIQCGKLYLEIDFY